MVGTSIRQKAADMNIFTVTAVQEYSPMVSIVTKCLLCVSDVKQMRILNGCAEVETVSEMLFEKRGFFPLH